MTKLLTIGLLLLSCGVVEAGDSEFTMPKPYVTPDISAKITYCSNGRCETTCEHKMKEAMKMVDRYFPYHEAFNGSTLEYEYCDDVCMAERALDTAKKKAAAMAKWRAVYKECVQ